MANNTFHRGTNNITGDATNSAGYTPSRLLNTTNNLRNELISRNLYTPNRIYPITEKNQLQNILNSVSSVINFITPFKSYDLKNTFYGRLVTSDTPLSEIGLAMLGNQFALNSASLIAKNNLPTMNLSIGNIVNTIKGKSSIFSPAVHYQITKKAAISNFQQFLDNVVYYYPGRDYPFKPTSTEANYIENTGTGQLKFLYTEINRNIYKQGFSNSNFFGIVSYNDTQLNQYSGKAFADVQLTKRNAIIGSKDGQIGKYYHYYNFFGTNPYTNISPTPEAVNQANGQIVVSLNNQNPNSQDSSATQEYAPTASFIKENFGTANKNGDDFTLTDDTSSNIWINPNDDTTDVLQNKIIWGIDGVSDLANERIAQLRGSSKSEEREVEEATSNLSGFKVYSGLLEYTRNLLNASQGAVVDITRKAFKKGSSDNLVGFNGSGLFYAPIKGAPGSTYAMASGTAGMKGVRQHTVIDQYDRFAKAIRFNGNYTYLGNPNSVIYKTVIPRIHPTTPIGANGVPNNRNLMFSLENLAVRVISRSDGVGIIDDEYGSMIPISEVGQFNGRLMWFPPYNVEINESTSAKFEPTVMVGRNEPMYSYMYSERSATLSFTLLVDYPQVLKNALYQGPADKHKIIAEFFAFGGDPFNVNPNINNTNIKTAENNAHIIQTTGPTNTSEPDTSNSPEMMIVFPNDMPKTDADVANIIDTMYLDIQYEIQKNLVSNTGVIYPGGKNGSVFFKAGLTGDPAALNTPNELHLDKSLIPGFSQYTATGSTNPYDSTTCDLNQYLFNIFNVVDNRRYFEINIVGHTTTLNDKVTDYNKKLGQRRADAAAVLVQRRLETMFGLTIAELGIKINTSSVGSVGAVPSNSEGKTQAEIDAKLDLQPAIEERKAVIQIVRTDFPPLDKPIQGVSVTGFQAVEQLKKDNAALAKVQSQQNTNTASQDIYKERQTDNENDSGDGAILKGFKSIAGNYYYPAFHSQTPEDFHKRLTFLQQCMRQGASKKGKDNSVDELGILRARNSVFGRQPICILRIGDFFFTKVVIENLTIDYTDTTWDMNPEGFGMQPMMAKVTLQMKVLGGQSLIGPIDALQNAVTFNYYANSNYNSEGLYARPAAEASKQKAYIDDILVKEKEKLTAAYNDKVAKAKLQATQAATTTK